MRTGIYASRANLRISRISTQPHSKYFEHVEQAFQWAKAVCSSDYDKAKKILALVDPYDIKQLGDEVEPSEQWALSEIDTLRAIAYTKFTQNRALGDRLRNSPYTSFYECTKNPYWGTGFLLPYTTHEIDTTKFEGANHFGVILRDVKARLIADAKKAAAANATNSQQKSPAKPTANK